MMASATTPTTTTDRPAADIAVIGAGIVGAACALELARAGMKVLVLDRQAPGLGASYGNAGHMATEQVFPIADAGLLKRIPGMLLDPLGPLRLDWRYLPRAMPWFVKLLWNMRQAPYQASTAGLRALNEASLPAWQALLDSIGRRELLKDEGSLLIHERSVTTEALEAVARRMQAQGVPVERLSRQAVLSQVPALTEKVQGGLFFPATGHVSDPHQVVLALCEAAERQGVRFSTCKVASVRASEEGVRLETSEGALTVPRVLVAAGAHSAPLVEGACRKPVPLDTERGYHLMLPREVERLPVAITSLERRFIMTPMAEGLRLAGTVEFAGLQRPPNMQRAWQLERLAQGLFRRPLNTEDATSWMGFRPSLPDSLPVIDRIGPQGRVWLAFGHHHLGLTQAAITARLVRHFHDDTIDSALPSLVPYRLGRFA
ncbi:NAD(P)/FAD-dependent oxidoreductase [Halomonas heilongjiangensis]|nr:FAD-dependent oxidoreductase [Halomonas heilongjiangensis]